MIYCKVHSHITRWQNTNTTMAIITIIYIITIGAIIMTIGTIWANRKIVPDPTKKSPSIIVWLAINWEGHNKSSSPERDSGSITAKQCSCG